MNTTRRRHREAQVRQWFAMWLTKQDTGMETLFAADAHYIESWGPEYHGRAHIQQWFAEWNTRGTVVQWDIGTFFHREDQAVVSWHFCAAMGSPFSVGTTGRRSAFSRSSGATSTAMTPMPRGTPRSFGMRSPFGSEGGKI